MKFSASISEFRNILNKTLPAMPRKSTMPILEHLSFSLEGNELTIIATDQEITIKTKMTVTGIEDGSVLVPGKRLSEIMRAFNDIGTFEFESDLSNFETKLSTVSGKYLMKGLDPNDYIDLPELFESEKPFVEIGETKSEKDSGKAPSAFFTNTEMSLLCEKTYFAVSKDEYKPAMTGVLFQFSGDLVNSVATDSFRLAKISIKKDNVIYPQDFTVIIPLRAVELLRKSENDVLMSFIESFKKVTHARFDFDDTVMITRIIDEKFPPYESVIPKESKFQAVVNLNDFMQAIKRVAICSNQTSHQIRLNFDSKQLIVTGEDEETGSYGKELINCDFNGEAVTIGFNFRYLEEALSTFNSEVTNDMVVLSFTEPNRPITIKADNETSNVFMLIMPVRLN